MVEEAESGSTATVVFARSDRLVVAYVGDSRVVRFLSLSFFLLNIHVNKCRLKVTATGQPSIELPQWQKLLLSVLQGSFCFVLVEFSSSCWYLRAGVV